MNNEKSKITEDTERADPTDKSNIGYYKDTREKDHISISKRIKKMSLKSKILILVWTPTIAVMLFMIITGCIMRGQELPQWYNSMNSVLACLLLVTVALTFVVCTYFNHRDKNEFRYQYTPLNNNDQSRYTRGYDKMTIDNQLKEMRSNGVDVTQLSETADELSRTALRYILIRMVSRTGDMYEFILDGKMCGYVKKTMVTIETVSGQHTVCIKKVGGDAIFEKEICIDKNVKFTVGSDGVTYR